MGENEKPSKRRKVAQEPAADDTMDPAQPDLAGKITQHLRQKQAEAQIEKQNKIREANKQLKREKRKNRVKKEKPTKKPSSVPVKKTTPEYALAYVRQWKEDRDSWKFQTLVQSWIMQNILDDDQISKEEFPLVEQYVVSARGAARRRLAEEMRSVLEARDRWPSLRAEGKTKQETRDAIGRDKPSKRAYRRARSILQSLDDEEDGGDQ